MPSLIASTITNDNITEFDGGSDANPTVRPNTSTYGLYNSDNTKIILGPLNNQWPDITYTTTDTYTYTYSTEVYRQFNDNGIFNGVDAPYTDYLLHIGNEWMRISGTEQITLGDLEDNIFTFTVLKLSRGEFDSSEIAHNNGETVELYHPYADWTDEEKNLEGLSVSSEFAPENNINFGVDGVTITPTLSTYYDPYSGIDILPAFASSCVREKIEVLAGVPNEYIFQLGVNTDNRIYTTIYSPLFTNEDGSVATDIVIHRITLSGDFNNTNESVSVQIGGSGINPDIYFVEARTLAINSAEFNVGNLSSDVKSSQPIVVFGPEKGDTNLPISVISNYVNDFGKVFYSQDMRSAVGGNASETGHDMTITITFIKTSVADTTTWITADEAGIPVNCDSPPEDGPLYTDNGEFSPFNEIVPWRVSCILGEDTNGEPILSTPIPWLGGTPQQLCYKEFTINFNTKKYWLSDRDGRPALGCFSIEEDNISKNEFGENIKNDTLFSQISIYNMVSNGDSRIIKNATYYDNNVAFGNSAFEPFGDWGYLQLDGVGYNIGHAFLNEGDNSTYPPPVGNPWGSLINTYIQSENYGSTSGQEEDGIYGYSGYYPYPFLNLNLDYQWAHWRKDNNCYSFGKCLRFRANNFWDDTTTSAGTIGNWQQDNEQTRILSLTNKNQYRTLNQYQKIYDTESGFLNPYSSLEVSFWMKTDSSDEYFEIDNPPQVEASILRGKNPGNTRAMYTEYGYGLEAGQVSPYTPTTLSGNGFTSNEFSDIGIENSNNDTMMTMINQNVFESETGLSSIDISEDRTLNIGTYNYEIFSIVNSLFSQYVNRTVTKNDLLPEDEVIVQGNQFVYHVSGVTSNNVRTFNINNNFFTSNLDGSTATNIILTRIEFEIDGGGSDGTFSLQIYDATSVGGGNNYVYSGSPRRSIPEVTGPNGRLFLDVRTGNTTALGTSTTTSYDRSMVPIPIKPRPAGQNNIDIVTDEAGGTNSYSFWITFEKFNPNTVPLTTQQYYFRVGEQWNYEWIRTTGYSLPAIESGGITNPLYSQHPDDVAGNVNFPNQRYILSALLQINLERGLFDTTRINHISATPVQVWSSSPELFNNLQLDADGNGYSLDGITTFHNDQFLEQFGNYNSITTTLNNNNSYQLGSMNRFKNNVLDIWEKKQFIFNFNDKHKYIQEDIEKVQSLFFAIQAGNDFKGTVLLDNFEVKESYEFRTDCDVRKKKGPDDYGVGDLTEYYDKNIPEQLEAYNDTTAPLEVQFYFYARYIINEPLNTNNPSHPIYNDFRNGMFYLYDVDWGDGAPKEFTTEPKKLGDDVAVYHTYTSGGIFEVTGYMIRMKPDVDYEPIGVIHNQKFTLRININEGLDEDFTYFGSDGFSFIPYKNTLPVIGGHSEQSIYYKSVKRQLGILSDIGDTSSFKYLDTKFKTIGDRLKTEIALDKMDTSYSNNFELLNEFKKERYSESDGTGDIVHNGYPLLSEELGNSIGDTDITNIRYFNKPKQMWEMLGFDNESIGIPNRTNYWKNIIPKDYSIYNREGLVDGEFIDVYSPQAWTGINEELGFENNYYYPVLPKYGADGKFIEGSVAGPVGGNLPFPLEGPITDEYYTDESLLISINKETVESNIFDDNSGNKNYGFVYGDYRPNFDDKTLEPKKNKNFSRIINTKKNGAF